MESWILLTDVLMLLGGAFIFGIAAQRFNQSVIIGYLLAGVVLGPFLFHAEPLMQLAELGVALLLFTIGLVVFLHPAWQSLLKGMSFL